MYFCKLTAQHAAYSKNICDMKEIKPDEIKSNPVRLIARDWMLVTAGTPSDFNTMTASWGMIGEMWGLDVVETVIRPQRFTRQFIENTGSFTLSFFPEEMRKLLSVMGSKSGREIDKMHYPGLEMIQTPSGGLTFKGAKLVIEAEVIYEDRFTPEAFRDKTLAERWYDGDFHHRYIGRITHVWTEE